MPRRKTTEEFINDAIKVHGDKYDYSSVNYTGNIVKIKIICLKHGSFEQTPAKHLKGQGCFKCGIEKNLNSRKISNEEFINKAIKIHGDKYGYSLVEYKTNRIKIKIICPEHGEFEQTPDNHLSGRNCKKCSKVFSPTTEEFIKEAKKIHGNNYDYSLVKYVNAYTKVKIICNSHDIFYQTPTNHLSGRGCKLCGSISGTEKRTLGTEKFIEMANIIHENKYDYLFVDYKNSRTKVKIFCKKHKEFFEQIPSAHLREQGCPLCSLSKGEKKVKKILDKLGIKYIRQKTFDGCIYKQKLQFDFYLPEYNICIEYDGIQHFILMECWRNETEFKESQIKDQIKNNFCKNNNILLYRISYNENIEKKMNNLLNKYLLLK